MRITWLNPLLIFLVSTAFLSCLGKLGAQLPPVNTRKLKKKISPPVDFNLLVLKYKKDHGHWPGSEMDLINASRSVVTKLYDAGFESWSPGDFSDDTLLIHFVHKPVFDHAHIGGIPIPGRQVKIKTVYVSSNGIIRTEPDKKTR